MSGRRRLTRERAEREGYAIDTLVSPWIGYKGPRFNASDVVEVMTDEEARVRAQRDRAVVLLRAVRSQPNCRWSKPVDEFLAEIEKEVRE